MSSKTKYIVLAGLIALAIFIIAWGLFLNKGTLTVVGEGPFAVEVVGEASAICETGSCSFRLSPDDYQVIATKTGYRQAYEKVDVMRWQESILEIDFQYQPTLTEIGEWKEWVLPESLENFRDSVDSISLLAEKWEALENLPRLVENIVFAPSGKYAAIYTQKGIVIYNTGDFTIQTLKIAKENKVEVSPDSTKIATLVEDAEARKQELIMVPIEEGKPGEPESIAFFPREVFEYELYISPDNSKIALVDKSMEDRDALYLIDIAEKSREKILESDTRIENVKWNPDSSAILYETASVSLLDLATKETKTLLTSSFLNDVVWTGEGNVIFANPEEIETEVANREVSPLGSSRQFGELAAALGDAYEVFAAEGESEAAATTYYFYEFNPAKNVYELLLSTTALPEFPKRMELSDDGKSVYFVSGGKFYQLKLEE